MIISYDDINIFIELLRKLFSCPGDFRAEFRSDKFFETRVSFKQLD